MAYRIECDTVDELRALLGQAPAAPPVPTVSERLGKHWRPEGYLHEPPSAAMDMLKTGRTAAELGIAEAELARAGRRTSDVASLSQPMPSFEDDPLAEDDGAARPPLTDKARSEFLQTVNADAPRDGS